MKGDITIVSTGGTIGSASAGQTTDLSPDETKVRDAVDEFCRRKRLTLKETASPLKRLSEDMRPSDWSKIASTIRDCIDRGIEGIVVTHGTDTMPYIAAFLQLLLGRSRARVCLAGSYYPPNHAYSDFQSNLFGAIECVSSELLKAGVYVACRRATHEVAIYHALDVLPMSPYQSVFDAVYGGLAATIQDNFFVTQIGPSADIPFDNAIPNGIDLDRAASKIWQIKAVPGMPIHLLGGRGREQLMIIEAYHSGTAYSRETPEGIVQFIRDNPKIRVALAPLPGRFIAKYYRSTELLKDAGVWIFRDIQPHVLYVGALIQLARKLPMSQALDAFRDFKI